MKTRFTLFGFYLVALGSLLGAALFTGDDQLRGVCMMGAICVALFGIGIFASRR